MAEIHENCPFAVIDSFILMLESTKKTLDDTFKGLEGMTQQEIDKIIVNEINPTINASLQSARDSLVDSLQKMYTGMLKLKEKLLPVEKSDPTAFSLSNLTAIIDAVMALKDLVLTMYDSILQFTVLLTQHIADLSLAISSLTAYRPPIKGINFDKLDIKCPSISMSDITG